MGLSSILAALGFTKPSTTSEAPDSKSSQGLSGSIGHAQFTEAENFSFRNEASKFLDGCGIKPTYGQVYFLGTRDPGYSHFLSQLATHLERLPMQNEIGETTLMRDDAALVIAGLKDFLRSQDGRLKDGKSWDSQELHEIRAHFVSGRLEVYKNEIYPAHKINGTGYNLDLSMCGEHASAIILEIYTVSQMPKFTVDRQGSFQINVANGAMILDLSEWPVKAHRGPGETD